MDRAQDIAKIAEQEKVLVFDSFDEARAFSIGSLLRERGLAESLPIIIDIRFWDRPLFYAALPGSTGSNFDWARRKRNVVEMFHKSTYRMGLELSRDDKTFPPGHGLDPSEFILAGGGFPITVKGVGVVGVIAVSGLPQRQDHELIVSALCEHLGRNARSLTLSAAE
ncbi:heme-degrading domain-containing protein [Mesorhizobium sp. NBSH29]|uniref:heme-degrading domain-containing protein n=1 Tax=Mesorhizobium sp. NBSH29 TaxID=2654249 RepID=UPI0018968A57|nr:heme-degrading domain-containing protein [Mesorhizobium sp. NBSH29]QPC85538.1 heme-degrading domain-containing protein [Mesorhizobium sp. NBSH29]